MGGRAGGSALLRQPWDDDRARPGDPRSRRVSEVRAVLIDLYDTLAWTEWPTMRAELEERFGISEVELLRAFTATREARSIGAYGSAEGDLAAVLEAAGVHPDADLVHELNAARARALAENGVHLWDDSIPTLR